MKKSSKYKIVGLVDLLLGAGQLSITFIELFFLYPKLRALYSDFNVKVDPVMTFGPVIFLVIIGVLNLVVGLKLLKKSKVYEEGYFKLGVASALIAFFLLLPLLGLNIASLFIPLYSLTSR